MLEENIDYKFIDDNDLQAEHYLIKLIKGQYTDVTYKYGNVRFTEEKNQLRISFDYTIHNTPLGVTSNDLRSDKKFNSHISNILGNILSTQEFKIGNGKSRDNDNQQFS